MLTRSKVKHLLQAKREADQKLVCVLLSFIHVLEKKSEEAYGLRVTENLAIKRSFSHNLVPVRTIRKCVTARGDTVPRPP